MSETLIYQLKEDLQDMFNVSLDYSDVIVKTSYDGNIDVSYPMVIIDEISNYDNDRYYDLHEHVVNVAYQFTILAEQDTSVDAEQNVRNILEVIKTYMRGDRYNSLQRVGGSPITTHPEDGNIKIGYVRYEGCIDIDNHIIYRRS